MLYIFDLDGTLIQAYMDRPDRNFFAPVEVLPGRPEKLAALLASGHKIAIASNQAGVAFQWRDQRPVTELDVRLKVLEALRALGLDLDTPVAVCFAHPKSRLQSPAGRDYADPREVRRRKPSGAMILELMREVLGTDTARSQVVLVGDRDTDQAAAQDAGVSFISAAEFFHDSAGDDLFADWAPAEASS